MFVYAMSNYGCFLFAVQIMIMSLIADETDFYCELANSTNVNNLFKKL